MIVYSDRKTRKSTREFLASLRSLRGVDLLIAFGQFEAGVVDALSPHQDDTTPAIRALRFAAGMTARAWAGKGQVALAPIQALELPEEIDISVPEGYSWYALYPEQYADAARRFLLEVEPIRSVVIGIRSIGASLSAVVAAEVDAVMSITVRPRGHPFDRHVIFSNELTERLRMQRGAHFLIVDEGPGISGSSFIAVADALGRLGVPDERIVLFPSWDCEGSSLRSERARARWNCFRRYTSGFENVVLPKLGEVADISAGVWRTLLYQSESDWPAVQPQHERRKYLRTGRTLLKFAGLGEAGRAAVKRATLLSDVGFGPEVLGYHDGFVAMRWYSARPHPRASRELARSVADYLDFLGKCAQVPGAVRYDEIVHMIEFNSGRSGRWDRACIEDAQLAAVDGRMLPHEWLDTPGGIVKADGVDHHRDHFFPGTQDIAWDYAAAEIELGLEASALTSDTRLLQRLPFYRAAYAAFRYGYCKLAAETLGTQPDAQRFSRESARYQSLLGQFLP